MCGPYSYSVTADITPEAFIISDHAFTIIPELATYNSESVVTISVENNYHREELADFTVKFNNYCIQDDLTNFPTISSLIVGGNVFTKSDGTVIHKYDLMNG